MTLSFGLIGLLEWLTELRATFYLLDHWLIIKGCNSGTGRWKRCVPCPQGMGEKGTKLPCFLRAPLSLHLHRSPTQKL